MKCSLLFLTIGALIMSTLFAQTSQRKPRGQITGTVAYSLNNTPIEYANIILFLQKDSTQITGTTTDKDGYFKLDGLRPGEYYIEILFIGYHAKSIKNINIKRGNFNIDLGDILLEETMLTMETVEVEAERIPIQYKIDKKIINVSGQPTASSGTAVDVLENVPSVTVDIEGNVSLRGSSNFSVLIDGRPSVLDADEVLHQLPASTIENIEIITNPSAKYDPEGTSGIINIIMKKTEREGYNGVVNLNSGLENKKGGDFIINLRREILNASFGFDYNDRHYPGAAESEKQTIFNGTTSYIRSQGNSERQRESFGIRGSLSYSLTKKDNLNIVVRYGGRSGARQSYLDYNEWNSETLIHNIYVSKDQAERSGDFYTGSADYQHKFDRNGHEFKTEISYSHREGLENSSNELYNENQLLTFGQTFTEDGPSDRYRLKMDYSIPFGKNRKIETGIQSQINNSNDITGLSEYDPDLNEYVQQPQFNNDVKYRRNIHAIYSIFSGEWKNFGYQGGIRTELTDRSIKLTDKNNVFSINRWDYFPTAHFSYNLTKGRQVMGSYSRRIVRPRGWYLEPFETWTDAYNVRKGNPSLKPQYIDSYEIGLQTFFGKNLFSAETYYRITDNKIERVQSVYDDDIILHTTENIGKDYSFGTEIMINADMFQWWNINIMGNLYNYKVDGNLSGNSFLRESFNWNTRFNNSFKIKKATRIQLNGIYNSRTVSSQGERQGFFVTNIALKQEFMERKLSATLQINDVFQTAKYEFTSRGANFYSYNHFTREAPVVMLNLTYNINNYKPERKRNGNDDNFEEEEI